MITRGQFLALALVFHGGFCTCVHAQDETTPTPAAKPVADNSVTPPGTETPAARDSNAPESVNKTVESMTTKTDDELETIARTVDQDPRAKTTAAGILQPIYSLAQTLSFPAFHWLAFALMSAGVVSYALQLVLGKLVVLTRLGFSIKEIVSDAAGLAISVIGLVLTTQAAVENSNFTQSPAAVISATAIGVIFGVVLYWWGQAQELQAAAGRSQAPVAGKR
jgi:hypothetical protein